MPKRARTRAGKGKRAKRLKVKKSNQALADLPQASRSAVSGLIETPGFYLNCLYATAIDLAFVAIFVKLHLAYDLFVVEGLPESLRIVSLILVTVLGMFRLVQVVRYNVLGYKTYR